MQKKDILTCFFVCGLPKNGEERILIHPVAQSRALVEYLLLLLRLDFLIRLELEYLLEHPLLLLRLDFVLLLELLDGVAAVQQLALVEYLHVLFVQVRFHRVLVAHCRRLLVSFHKRLIL